MRIKCSFLSRKNTEGYHHLYVPANMLAQYPFQRNMTLWIGHASLNVTCLEAKTDSLQIMLDTGDSLFSSIPELENIWISFNPDTATIRMGPVVALLIHPFNPNGIHTHPLMNYFIECHNWFQRKGGFFYLLPLPSFLGSRQEGAAYNGHIWEMAPLPAPDVIYNRCHSRKVERSPSFQGSLSRFEEKKIHVFNRGFLSKDEVYEALKDSPVISPHLPETVNGLDSLEEMLASCNDVFVKAVDGSRGRYIIRIQKRERDYLVHQNSFGAKSPLTFPSTEALLRQIKSWCRRSSYLVQETISFVKVDGCSLDFRYLCHLDENGTWQIVSSVARVSSPHQFVANVDQGGVIEKPAAILQTLFPEKAVEISNEMKKLCFASARLLADSIDGHFAELGMDIGIDGSGKPWMIEVNAKPSKRTYTEASAIRPSVKSLYAYSYRKWIHKED